MTEKKLTVFNSIDYVPLDQLKIHPRNTEMRTISPTQWKALKASILKNGFFEPIHVWAKDGTVLAGNHRVLIARDLVKSGFEFESPVGPNCIPAIVHECDEKTALSILLQTNNQYAEYIESGLSKLLKDLNSMGGDVRILGFSDAQVDSILGTALKEAEAILADAAKGVTAAKEEAERTIAPVDAKAIEAKVAEKDRIESELKNEAIWLDPDVCAQLKTVLATVARKLNKHWREGDSLDEATGALVQLWRERDMIEEIDASGE